MGRKINLKPARFSDHFEKRKLFPLVFHVISEKWLLLCGYATFQHLACERQTFLLAHRSLRDGSRGAKERLRLSDRNFILMT